MCWLTLLKRMYLLCLSQKPVFWYKTVCSSIIYVQQMLSIATFKNAVFGIPASGEPVILGAITIFAIEVWLIEHVHTCLHVDTHMQTQTRNVTHKHTHSHTHTHNDVQGGKIVQMRNSLGLQVNALCTSLRWWLQSSWYVLLCVICIILFCFVLHRQGMMEALHFQPPAPPS